MASGVTHGAQIGGIRIFADHTLEIKRKQNVSTIFSHRAAFYACLSSRSDRSTYAPDESRLLWWREKPEYPQFEPHRSIEVIYVIWLPRLVRCNINTS